MQEIMGIFGPQCTSEIDSAMEVKMVWKNAVCTKELVWHGRDREME